MKKPFAKKKASEFLIVIIIFPFITCVFVLKARLEADLDAGAGHPVAVNLVAVHPVAVNPVAVHPADDNPADQPTLEV